MSFILLISDYQSDSYKTGILKTVLHTGLKDIEIIDITHHIRLNNTIEAAFVCKQLQQSDNQDTVIIVKVGSHKELVVYQHLSHLYILPNNGLLYMVIENPDKERIFLISSGQDVKAIHAFREGRLSDLPKAGDRLVMRYNKTVQMNGEMAIAECIYSDRHGNCYFNLSEEEFRRFTGEKKFQIRIQHYTGHVFTFIGTHVTDVDEGEAIFRFSESGYLKLQIHLGNAQQLFRIKDDTKIIIETL